MLVAGRRLRPALSRRRDGSSREGRPRPRRRSYPEDLLLLGLELLLAEDPLRLQLRELLELGGVVGRGGCGRRWCGVRLLRGHLLLVGLLVLPCVLLVLAVTNRSCRAGDDRGRRGGTNEARAPASEHLSSPLSLRVRLFQRPLAGGLHDVVREPL